jgi:hypothetical protein
LSAWCANCPASNAWHWNPSAGFCSPRSPFWKDVKEAWLGDGSLAARAKGHRYLSNMWGAEGLKSSILPVLSRISRASGASSRWNGVWRIHNLSAENKQPSWGAVDRDPDMFYVLSAIGTPQIFGSLHPGSSHPCVRRFM